MRVPASNYNEHRTADIKAWDAPVVPRTPPGTSAGKMRSYKELMASHDAPINEADNGRDVEPGITKMHILKEVRNL